MVGAYEYLSDISDRLLRALPPLMTVSHADWDSPLVPLLETEMLKDEPGQEEGRVQAVKDYLSRIAAGGYA